MQDRFKFRTYDKRTKEMLNVRLISYFNTGNICRVEAENAVGDIIIFDDYKTSIEDIELMQCTGLKDKNGTLIYEGDIVKIEYYDFEIKHRIGIVEWEDDGFCITYHNPKDTKVSGCSLVDIVNGDKQEVIGNIYETPELIGGE